MSSLVFKTMVRKPEAVKKAVKKVMKKVGPNKMKKSTLAKPK